MDSKVKKNIVFLTKYFFPHIGGVERHIKILCKELRKKSYGVTVITEKYLNNLDEFEIVNNIRVYRFKRLNIKWIGLLLIWGKFFSTYYKLLLNADIIHIHDVFIWYLPFKLIFRKKPVYITFHGYESYPISQKEFIIRKLAEKLTNGNICVGDFIRKWYKTKPNIVTYGAVGSDFKKIKSTKNVRYNAIFVGRLDAQTGIKIYLEAVKSLMKRGLKFNFLIVGDGPYIEEAKYVGECIGEVYNVETYLNVSRDAFVSRYLSILEAFSLKKMVFAVYDNPIKKDYLKNTPFSKWIVVCNKSETLINQINFYNKNHALKKSMIDNAYNWVKNQSPQKLAEDYLRLWNLHTN